MESMFKSYFTSGLDISKILNITSVAREVDGIDGKKKDICVIIEVVVLL